MPKDAGRNAQVVRLLNIVRDLDRTGGVDLYELAQRYGTTVRTVRRDLVALTGAGLPLVEEPGEGARKRWRLAYRDSVTKIATLLDASHYLAVRVAMSQDGVLRSGSPLFSALEDLSDKIETAVGKKGRSQLEAIAACLYSYEKFAYHQAPPDVLWPLVGAVADHRLCRVTYRAPRQPAVDKIFDVLPLRVFAYHGALYLQAHVPKHGKTILLHLSRLVSLDVLAKRGKPPRGDRPEALENLAFGVFSGGPITSYRLRFSRDVAPYVRERRWHVSQKLRELPDGRVELQFKCAASGEVSGWVSSWRGEVEVIEPESLRSELAEVARQHLALYAKAPPARAAKRRQAV